MIIDLNNQDMYYPKTVFVSQSYSVVVPIPLPANILTADFPIEIKMVAFTITPKEIKSITGLR